jgi:hypothetical protein
MVRLVEGAPGVRAVTGPIYSVWNRRMNVAHQPFDQPLTVERVMFARGQHNGNAGSEVERAGRQ